MEHIGEILRTAREDNFYTQKKVMELTGINRKTLSGYENTSHQEELLIQFQSLADYLDKKSK